jgi:nucleotide-binding universal stress UspA family protein
VPKKKQQRSEPGPILVPVDFSPHSAAALAWAARLSACLEAPLQILHVAHDPESAPGYYRRSKRKKHLHRIEEAAAEMMDEFLEEVIGGQDGLESLRKVEPLLVVGLPVTRILEVADKLGASMIVMGSQGRTGLPHLLLGSKAERIAQLAPIPVTIVKSPADKASRK